MKASGGLGGTARIFLVAALVGVVVMAFRVSWNALRDIAMVIGADPTAATLYPIVVDGLMALALVATLVLRDSGRRFALWVLGGYTAASLVLNYVHGLAPGLHESAAAGSVRLADWAPAHWALVLLASALPVGGIFFGSDLVAKVLHHDPTAVDVAESAAESPVGSTPDLPVSVPSGPVESTPIEVDSERTGDGPGRPTPTPTAPRPQTRPTPTRPRRPTGPVPDVLKDTAPPKRTDAELLAEAVALTAEWSDDRITAQALREGLRIGADRSRSLRDALLAERADARTESTDEGDRPRPRFDVLPGGADDHVRTDLPAVRDDRLTDADVPLPLDDDAAAGDAR